MIVVFHDTDNKKLLSDHDVKIYLIAFFIFRLLLCFSGILLSYVTLDHKTSQV